VASTTGTLSAASPIFITDPGVDQFVQYTLVASTTMLRGADWADARSTGWQAPATHAPPRQSCPQAPQFAGSLSVFVQPPLELLPLLAVELAVLLAAELAVLLAVELAVLLAVELTVLLAVELTALLAVELAVLLAVELAVLLPPMPKLELLAPEVLADDVPPVPPATLLVISPVQAPIAPINTATAAVRSTFIVTATVADRADAPLRHP
jgi:hypothetical protein